MSDDPTMRRALAAFADKAATFDRLGHDCGTPRVGSVTRAGTVRARYANGLVLVYEPMRGARIIERPGGGDGVD